MDGLTLALLAGVAGLALLIAIGRRWHRVDWHHPLLNLLEGLNQFFCRRYHRLRHDPVVLPETGPALVVSNHYTGLDAMLMIAASPRPLRFIIAREQYERPGLRPLFKAVGCIPVDRSARPETALRAALRELENGEVIALFPDGRIHLEGDPPRRLKGGVAWLARRTGCPIVPLRVTGTRAHGHVLRPVLLRADARIAVHPSVHCTGQPHEHCLQRLAQLLAADPPRD